MSDNAASPLILAVDDDELSRSLLEAVLLRAGYRVVVAASGYMALALARQARPAAAICDVRLTDSDGFAVARALTTDLDPAIPVILLTGYPAPGDAETAEISGAAALLSKSRDREELLATLAALLSEDSGGPARRAG